jgi:hypothetical protein
MTNCTSDPIKFKGVKGRKAGQTHLKKVYTMGT